MSEARAKGTDMPWLVSQARSSRRKARRVFVLGESSLACAIWTAICQSARTWSRQESSCMGGAKDD